MSQLLFFSLSVIYFCLLSLASAEDSEPILTKEQQDYFNSVQSSISALELRGDDHETDNSTDLVCPSRDEIAPCFCSTRRGFNVACIGFNVTQLSVNKAITSLRSANKLESFETLKMTSFQITLTRLKTLDLFPFSNTEIDDLYIFLNCNLTTLTNSGNSSTSRRRSKSGGPSLRGDDPSAPASIEARSLNIVWNPITDKGFGNTLRLFSPKMVNLVVAYNKIEGSKSEILRGISQLKNLNSINLSGNQIKDINGGKFRSNSRLSVLALGLNKITEIGDGAFMFLTSGNAANSNQNLTIDLPLNNLTDEAFTNVKRSGLTNSKRPIILNLQLTKIDSLPEANFRPFLQSNPNNRLNLQFTFLTCDDRMKWLKDNRDTYEPQVLNARCKNDKFRSVFDSKKIS